MSARLWFTAPGVLLVALSAGAETYQVLLGRVADQELTGTLESGQIRPGEVTTFAVDDFAFVAGGESFEKAPPLSHEGIVPIFYTRPVDHITRALIFEPGVGEVGADVDSAHLRSGGAMDVFDAGVVVHYLDFRSDATDAGYTVGTLGPIGDPALLPRRIQLAGTLVEVEEGFEFWWGQCPEPAEETSSLPECVKLRWFASREREIGRFQLIATGARPIPIDVRPVRADNVVLPSSPGYVQVAILGARPLDVCGIDEHSLRLGDGAAEPMPWSGRELARERDIDGDGALDLVARFRVRDAGIEVGDDSVCLVAQDSCGYVYEGCDAISTQR